MGILPSDNMGTFRVTFEFMCEDRLFTSSCLKQFIKKDKASRYEMRSHL